MTFLPVIIQTSCLKQTRNQNWGRDFSRVFLILLFHKSNQLKSSILHQNSLPVYCSLQVS